jgi:cellulose synthase/poly-beta-1,6-N-acetylglucosamine synthase-like glycosyltransferase
LDQGLNENLRALRDQDYPEYELLFVVDDEADAAVPVIRSVSTDAELIIAPQASGTSQKVENLREAVLHVSPRSRVLVFADSDARPGKDWLRHLVAPLADETVGVATGYRWFVSPDPTFASELRSVWNASIASSLGPGDNNQFCWGGAMAIRREVFDRLGVRDKWKGTVSDDFVLARVVRDAGLAIRFVPQALTASLENCTLPETLEFTTRQMKLTRVYSPALWKMSYFGSGLFNAVMIAAFAITVFERNDKFAVAAAISTLAAVSAFSIAKAHLRLKAVERVLTGHEETVRRQWFSQLTLWALTPALFFYNCTRALFSRTIDWRGITYILRSPTETVIRPGDRK